MLQQRNSVSSISGLTRQEQKKEDGKIDLVYLMGRQFHRRKSVMPTDVAKSKLQFFQSGSTDQSQSYNTPQNIQQSPLPSQIKPSPNSSIVIHKLSRSTLIPKIILRPNLEGINQFTHILPNDELVDQIKQTRFQDFTLWEMLELIAINLKQLITYKNDRSALMLVDKICSYQQKYKEIKLILLINSKPKEWSADLFLKRIILHYTKVHDRVRVMKKNKIERFFLQALFQFNQKIEEQNMKCSQEMYRTMELQILDSTSKLLDKEQEVQQQFLRNGQQNYYISNLLKNRHQTNARRLINDNYSQITEFEEKHGTFSYIKNLTRHTSCMINNVVFSIQKH